MEEQEDGAPGLRMPAPHQPISFTDKETEKFRRERLEARAEEDVVSVAYLAESFAPGTYGCHEALQMASVFEGMVSGRLCEHPAILANPGWFKMASDAQTMLFNLYQAIGALHLGDAQEEFCGRREPVPSEEGKRPENLNASNDD